MASRQSPFQLLFPPSRMHVPYNTENFTLKNSFCPDFSLHHHEPWARLKTPLIKCLCHGVPSPVSTQTHLLSLWFLSLSTKPCSFWNAISCGLFLQFSVMDFLLNTFHSSLIFSLQSEDLAGSHLSVWCWPEGPKLSCTNSGNNFKLYTKSVFPQSSL